MIEALKDVPSYKKDPKGYVKSLTNAHYVSKSRINELLDYASCYGDYDENTPNGTASDSGTPMSDERRGAIKAYKHLLGLIPTP